MQKILIIEDDQVVANIYRNRFAVEGYQVEVALDGQAGLDLLRSFRPDAVVLDLMIPRMTGVELMKKMRSEPDLEKIPVIVFSNTYVSDMLQEAWKAGATKCLSKATCTPRQVIELVRSLANGTGPQTPGAPSSSPSPAAPHTRAAALPPFPQSLPTKEADLDFQAELRKSFTEGFPATMGALRGLLQSMVKTSDEPARLKLVRDLYSRIHTLTGSAGIVGLVRISLLADALEALLKELHEKPKNINASTLRTVASGIDFVGVLFDRSTAAERQELPEAQVLVVDDEAISRRAISFAVEKAKLKPISVEDPVAAYKLLTEQKFDLVFLDVDMPGMNGFELCTKLRALPLHKKTPVVFVTSLNDFESRANSTISGGNDFIAKPFLFIELAVKALVYVLRSRLEARK
jgi:CheY-like chemotaxis protein